MYLYILVYESCIDTYIRDSIQILITAVYVIIITLDQNLIGHYERTDSREPVIGFIAPGATGVNQV